MKSNSMSDPGISAARPKMPPSRPSISIIRLKRLYRLRLFRLAVQYFRNRSNAIFFQDYLRILPKVQLLAGGRYDAFRRVASFNPVVNGVETPGAPLYIVQDPFSYRVALNVQVFPFISIYTNYSTSFVAQRELSP